MLFPFPDFVEYKLFNSESGTVLYTNYPRVVAEYTADVKDVAMMDEIFCEALSWKLASSIAFKLTGNAQIASMAESPPNGSRWNTLSLSEGIPLICA